MRRLRSCLSIFAVLVLTGFMQGPRGGADDQVFGFRDFSRQAQIDRKFNQSPDPKLAEEHLRVLTQAPHVAGSPEDRKTAEYVAQKFREAGLETQIVEYKVLLSFPEEVSLDVTAPANVKMHGPSRERVDDDPYQDDPRVLPAYNAYSPSGDAEAEVVYANYGSPQDYKQLESMKVDVRGKIVVVRYGGNYRGVKSLVAQEHGAAGVIIYSDPIDDGYYRGDMYPKGPFRPATGVQRGSIDYTFKYAGDPTTPGIASLPSLPDSQRTAPSAAADLPKIMTMPISYGDAAPMMQNLGGPESPREWQGAMPFTYHAGPGPVRVKMHLKMTAPYKTIWDVIGTVRGAELPDEWVIGGNHRDAWVYGAVDPSSGTAAMLESVHGVGDLLKSGWKPRRTMVFCSWDGEEEGMIGSTEWGEQHAQELQRAAAYLNMDVGVAGPNFGASAVPALKQFVRDVTKQVPSPRGGTVYQIWKDARERERVKNLSPDLGGSQNRPPAAKTDNDVEVGDLGSGSDYSVFLQHLGVPATDIGSGGPYGVYHSVFDNFAWFKKFGDPDFKYEQQMARVFGIEMLHMAAADYLPEDYELYGREIVSYVQQAESKAKQTFGTQSPSFADAGSAAQRFQKAGAQVREAQNAATTRDSARLDRALIEAERALLIDQGLPNRPWFRHVIYAPGEYTGYAAVVIPGVNEAIEARDLGRTSAQLAILSGALNRAAAVLENYSQGRTG
ncbi:MAG: glutamate carboxypeptidase [Acidobacteria bacterium]|nr:MAG: glutamate carboxypeptidase [Acidobacteriota bacterium]